MDDVLRVPEFFDARERARLEDAMRAAAGGAASVSGLGAPSRAVYAQARRATVLDVDPALRERVTRAFTALIPAVCRRFGVDVTECEPPQFVRYVAGDFFVPHQDGNTPLIRDATLARRVSAVVFVSRRAASPGDGGYEGGELVLHASAHAGGAPHVVDAAPGTLIAFRAETTHEVTPVVAGERHTIVTWYRSAATPA